MAKRKRNPGIGTLLGIIVVGAGGYFLYNAYANDKKKAEEKKALPSWRKPIYSINADCSQVGAAGNTPENVAYALTVLKETAKELGANVVVQGTDDDPENVFVIVPSLEPKPGDYVKNTAFADAWADKILKVLVHPACKAVPTSFIQVLKQMTGVVLKINGYAIQGNTPMPGATADLMLLVTTGG